MNEKLQNLLELVQRTAWQAGDLAADAVYGAGQMADDLLSSAKLRVRAATVEGEIKGKLTEVGRMVYATHTGTPSDSEDIQEILEYTDGLYQQLAGRRRALRGLEGLARFCVCGEENPPENSFCRACGRPL